MTSPRRCLSSGKARLIADWAPSSNKEYTNPRTTKQFFLAYRSLCPSGWYQRWDDQREAGNFPAKLD